MPGGVMIGLPWLKMAPWGIAALMALIAGVCLHLYQAERDAHVAYKATIAQAIADQQAALKAEANRMEANLKQVRQDYEDKIETIRSNAVALYRMRQPAGQSGAMPAATGGKQMDDGTAAKCVADEFVADAADDAAKVSAWQDWCKRNNCPIESP